MQFTRCTVLVLALNKPYSELCTSLPMRPRVSASQVSNIPPRGAITNTYIMLTITVTCSLLTVQF